MDAWRSIYSPRLRFAGRPSLRQVAKRVKKESSQPSFPLAEERVVERSKDRVSKLNERYLSWCIVTRKSTEPKRKLFLKVLLNFMSSIIRFAEINEYPEIVIHYETCNYHGGVQANDKRVIAVDGQVIGAVRICFEHGIKVLRGMQISPAWQKKRIGSSMLKFLTEHVDMDGCYCLPFKHLKLFYGAIGFEEIPIRDAPEFLAERLEKYLSSGYNEMVVMAINKNK